MKKLILASTLVASQLSQIAFAAPLADRFAHLSCAVVRLDYDEGSGTGFFIDQGGHIATAAHVAYERVWSVVDNKPSLTLVPHTHMKATLANNTSIDVVYPAVGPGDLAAAGNDLAILQSNSTSPCHLDVGEANDRRVGDHLISIGYPASNPTGVLYDGFLSARHTHLPVPIGTTAKGEPIKANYEVLRVQMPITPGASGSPVIDDNDQVVGVVSEVPLIEFQDVQKITRAYMSGGGSGAIIGGFDLDPIVGHLALMMTEFESPGSGYAVPLHGLKH